MTASWTVPASGAQFPFGSYSLTAPSLSLSTPCPLLFLFTCSSMRSPHRVYASCTNIYRVIQPASLAQHLHISTLHVGQTRCFSCCNRLFDDWNKRSCGLGTFDEWTIDRACEMNFHREDYSDSVQKILRCCNEKLIGIIEFDGRFLIDQMILGRMT